MSTLTERYVHAVVRRLPEGMRDDVAADVTAMIADMLEARGTPTPPDEPTPHDSVVQDPAPQDTVPQDTAAEALVLEELGSPVALAQEYARTPQYLIGPDLYPTYRAALTRLVPLAVVVALVANGIAYALTAPAPHVGGLIGTAIGKSAPALLIALSVVTILFAVFERVGPRPAGTGIADAPTTNTAGTRPIGAGAQQPISQGYPGRRRWTVADLEDLPPTGGSVRVNAVGSLIVLAFLAVIPLLPTTLFYVGHLNDGETFVNPGLGAGWLFGYWLLLVLMAVGPIIHVIRGRTTRGTGIRGAVIDVIMAAFLTVALLTQEVVHPDLAASAGIDIALWLVPVIWAITLWGQIAAVRAHRSSLRTMPADRVSP